MKLREPSAPNYRGERLSVRLGIGLGWATALLLGANAFGHERLVWILVGVAAVFGAGLYDDARPHRTRGMRRQLTALARGEVTPGVVKLVVIVAAAVFTEWMLGERGGRLAVGAAVLAGTANLWNLLDVRPGRSLKAFMPPAAALAATAPWPLPVVFVGLIGVAVLALQADLRELFMLGDCGANVLGFMVGIGTVQVLPLTWLAAVLAGIVVLHVLADTVTLSRIIDSTPPLRLVDRLGRKKFDENP